MKMNLNDVEVIEKTSSWRGYFQLDTYRLKHKLYAGGWSEEMSRELFERGHAAAALLYDPVRDELVMIEQFRIGAFAAIQSPWFNQSFSPWLLECVAGIIEDGENPPDVIGRESIEEAGCTITDLEPMFHYLASPGASTESIFLFCARTDSSNAGGLYGLKDEHEDIRVKVLPCLEAFELLDTGKIINATALIALQWLRSNRERLQDIWLNTTES